MTILGIDPGYAIVGWGVLEYSGSRFCVKGYGAITTPAGMDFPKRLEMIYQDMQTVLQLSLIHIWSAASTTPPATLCFCAKTRPATRI